MKTLAKIFGDEDLLKILRLFIFNPESAYTLAEVMERTSARKGRSEKSIKALLAAGAIRKRLATGRSEARYALNPKFAYASPVADLLAAASLHADETLVARIAPAGKVRLVIASGIFMRDPGSRLDLLVAGDEISEARLAQIVKALEADIGRELSYSSMPTAEFDYRLAMHDRLVRDVLDFPHKVVLDRIGLFAKK